MTDFKHVPTGEWAKVRALSLEDLLVGAREGLDMHLGELRRRYGEAIYETVAWLAPAAASEVVQDVFVDLPRLLEGYEDRGNFVPWLRRVARNRARTQARSLWNRADVEVSMTPGRALEGVVRSPSESIVNGAFRERLLGLLHGREREVWILKERGFSHDEIAAELDISVSNSQKILSRTRDKLLRRIQEWHVEKE